MRAEPKFDEVTGLVPAIIQDVNTMQVLMLGYMNEESLKISRNTGFVTFFSRSKNRLWQKGEESGNTLAIVTEKLDCDEDTLIFQVIPTGPTCHTGTKTCWQEEATTNFGFLNELENTISDRIANPDEKSYINSLMQAGINKVAQKVGEEGVEVVIEALGTNNHLFLEESADLLFHYLLLLQAKGFKINDVIKVLAARAKK